MREYNIIVDFIIFYVDGNKGSDFENEINPKYILYNDYKCNAMVFF